MQTKNLDNTREVIKEVQLPAPGQGPAGPDGEDGAAGADGEQGDQGPRGVQGIPGNIAEIADSSIPVEKLESTLEGSNIASGHVATADGAGGVEWEAASGSALAFFQFDGSQSQTWQSFDRSGYQYLPFSAQIIKGRTNGLFELVDGDLAVKKDITLKMTGSVRASNSVTASISLSMHLELLTLYLALLQSLKLMTKK